MTIHKSFVGAVVTLVALCQCGTSEDGGTGGSWSGSGSGSASGSSSGSTSGSTSGSASGGGSGGNSGSSSGGSSGSSSGGGDGGGPSDGGGDGGAADGGRAMQAFKGVAFYASTCSDLNTLDVSWYYDWQETTTCTGVEFVPHVWGDWTAGGGSWGGRSPAQLAANGATTVLAFNEPDNPGQSNLSVDQAIALWPQFDLPGVKIGSPGTGGACCPNTGEDWLNQFIAAIAQNKLRQPDIIAIHWYGWGSGECDDTSQLEAKIQWAEQWNLPIWITEWGCYQAESTQVVDKFYTDAIAMFKNHPLLERYAWYLSRSSSDPNFANATLLDQNGNPTALGSEYVAAPSYR